MRFLFGITSMVAILIVTVLGEDPCYIKHRTVKGNEYPLITTDTMSDCMAECAKRKECRAIVYGVLWPKEKRCYMIKAGYGGRTFTLQYHLAILPCEKLKVSCPRGMYRPSYDGKSCGRCPYNTYSKGGRVDSCTKCPSGKFSSPGWPFCFNCRPGQYAMGTGLGCGMCGPGSWSGKLAVACSPCAANTFSSSQGRYSCEGCPAGTYSGTGSISCSACQPGQFGAATGTGCSSCPANSYSDQVKSTNCTSCSTEHISPAGSTSRGQCIEVLNGAICWATTEEGAIEDAKTFEDTYLACKADSTCKAVTCKRNKSESSTVECTVGGFRGKVTTSGHCGFNISDI